MSNIRLLIVCIILIFGAVREANSATVATKSESPNSSIEIPKRIFTPKMIALIKQGKPYSELFRHTTSKGAARKAPGFYNKIPVSKWNEIISPFAPVSMGGARRNTKGKCPFCGKLYKGCVMSRQEFLSSPFQAKTKCCRKTVYARKKNMPSDYIAKPNHIEAIPHLDGTVYNYNFYIPPGKEKDKKAWFCSEGEVWRVRQKHLIDVFLACSSAAYVNNDKKAVLQLVAIFDRLADVFPGYPLYDSQMPYGFAKGRDGKSYLTRKEYLSVSRPQAFEKPFWFRWENWHFDKLPASFRFGGWHNGGMMWTGILASGFDMIRDRPEVKAWSTSKYGDPDAFEKRVMERLFKEYQNLWKSVPAMRNNTIWTWIRGALPFGILMQDEYFIKEAVKLLEYNIINNYYSDGLSTEGSFAYAKQMIPLINNLWVVKQFSGIDLNKKYPFLKQINAFGYYPIQTLYNVESMHGDVHGLFFASSRLEYGIQPPDPGKEDYPAHEKSQCFPETGLTCLRAGTAGNRLETIMDFQASSSSHTHNGRLNIQLFYEGVNLLPDFGYGQRMADISKKPWKDYKYNFDKLPITMRNKVFRETYIKQPQSHCLALVDGVNNKRGPSTFHRFLGGQGLTDPRYTVQFIEADSRAVFSTEITFKGKGNVSRDPSIPEKVSRFRRQLVTITLPNGRAVMLDIFRIKGGKRHEMYWHIPAKTAKMSLGKAKKIEQQTVQEYMRSVYGDVPRKLKYNMSDSGLEYLNTLKQWQMPNKTWNAEWLIQPSKFEPVSSKGRKRYKKWARILHDVKLRIWGFASGSKVENSEIISARGPWPSGMSENKKREKVLAFIDSLDFLIELRKSKQAPLESTFVHVLEPYNPAQGPVLADVKELKGENDKNAVGCAVQLEVLKDNSKDKTTKLLVATTINGGDFHGDNIDLKGRLGMVCRDNLNLVLYDGTQLQTKDFGVNMKPGWQLKLESVVGDLSGKIGESALIVNSAYPLPVDKTLVGQMLTVNHQISDIHTTGYTIDKVISLGKNRYLINLRSNPPFIQYKTSLRKLDKKNPFYVYGSSPNTKGACSGLFQGRRIRFPRTGFSSPIKSILWARESGTDLIKMEKSIKDKGIKIGDSFIIHTIQTGDEVIIPALFAMRQQKTKDKNIVKLDIFTTGTAKLQLPSDYQVISLLSANDKAVPFSNNKNIITINHKAIKDGRAVLNLKRLK